jgi:hypothetical protein
VGAVVPVREERSRDDDQGWRTVLRGGTAGTERDLSDWPELLREAYASNPLAYAVIETDLEDENWATA